MGIFRSRAENELYKLLAHGFKALLPHADKEGEKIVKDMCAVMDGYFLVHRAKVRKNDRE